MTELEVKGLAYEICLQSHAITSVDRNDTERVLKGKRRVDGFRAEYAYGDCADAADNTRRFVAAAGESPAHIIIYIDASEEDGNTDIGSGIEPLARLIQKQIENAPEQTGITFGLGKNESVRPGHFRLLIMAGYE